MLGGDTLQLLMAGIANVSLQSVIMILVGVLLGFLGAIIVVRPWQEGMGAYGHGRWRETLFGGVTRFMLGELGIPVLLAH